jgi:hypothetical protein
LSRAWAAKLLYPPPYSSPGFDPLEEAFSKVKGLIRTAEARSREAIAIVEDIGKALNAVTASDARGFFEYRAYRASVNYFDRPSLTPTPS